MNKVSMCKALTCLAVVMSCSLNASDVIREPTKKNSCKRFTDTVCNCIPKCFKTSVNRTEEKKETTFPVIKQARVVDSEGVIHISKKDDLLGISQEQASKIKSISFEDARIDAKFFESWCSKEAVLDNVDEVIFLNCNLSDGITYSNILDGMEIAGLSIIGSDLSDSDLRNSLVLIDNHKIKKLKITKNTVKFDESTLKAVLDERIFGVLELEILDLSENNLSAPFKKHIIKRTTDTGMIQELLLEKQN